MRAAADDDVEAELNGLADRLIQAIHAGRLSGADGELYLPLVEATTRHLDAGVSLGWNAPDPRLRQLLADNITRFSGFKTLAVQRAMAEKLTDEAGNVRSFADFRPDALAVHQQYNERYLRTEYEACVASAQMASKWSGFGEGALLRYDTANDDRVRTDHQAYDGKVLPRDHAFWTQHYPPCDWGCRCDVVEVDDDTPVTPARELQGLPPVPEEFRPNVGQTGTVFDLSHHAYGDVPQETAQKVDAQLRKRRAPKAVPAGPVPFGQPQLDALRTAGVKVIGGDDATVLARLQRLLPASDLPGLHADVSAVARKFRFKWQEVRWVVQSDAGNPYLNLEYVGVAKGKDVYFVRKITLEKGLPVAHHEFLTLPEHLQGKDVSRQLNRAMYRQYQLAGVNEVRVHAALEAGGYAWAKAGFEATNPVELYDLLTPSIRAEGKKPMAALDQGLLDELWKEVDDHFHATPNAPFPIWKWAQTDFGKPLLIRSSWHGVLALNNPLQKGIFEEYLRLHP